MLVSVAAGLAFGVAAAVGIAPITPSVDIRLTRVTESPQFIGYLVTCMARGAEPADELSIEVASGPVRLVGNTLMKDLPPSWRASFQVQIARTGEKGSVRVVQKGRAPRVYPVEIPGDTP